jgi:molybdopterin-guanine dinucleotide biosynthesis protein A
MGISGIILSGGKSTRMGQDKGLIKLNGKPMIQHVIDHIDPICDQILISANDKTYEDFGYPVCEDEINEIGPAGGIISCLKHSKNEQNIIISCDLPFASTQFIRTLLDMSGDYQITLPMSGPHYQPLCAVYSKEVYPVFMECVNKGIYSLKSIIKAFRIQVIRQEDIKGFDLSFQLRNINSPDDFTSLIL